MGIFNRKPKVKVKHVAGTQAASDKLVFTNAEKDTRVLLAKMGKSAKEIDAYIALFKSDGGAK